MYLWCIFIFWWISHSFIVWWWWCWNSDFFNIGTYCIFSLKKLNTYACHSNWSHLKKIKGEFLEKKYARKGTNILNGKILESFLIHRKMLWDQVSAKDKTTNNQSEIIWYPSHNDILLLPSHPVKFVVLQVNFKECYHTWSHYNKFIFCHLLFWWRWNSALYGRGTGLRHRLLW